MAIPHASCISTLTAGCPICDYRRYPRCLEQRRHGRAKQATATQVAMEIASTTAHPHAAACWQWPGHLTIVRAVAAGGPPLLMHVRSRPLCSDRFGRHPSCVARRENHQGQENGASPFRTRAARELGRLPNYGRGGGPRSECFGSDAPTMRREPYGSLSLSAAGAKVHHSQLALPSAVSALATAHQRCGTARPTCGHASFAESAHSLLSR